MNVETGDVEPADILVVDDDPRNLSAIEASLSELGGNLVMASSGQEALRQLLSHDFAVILLDVQMPGMDGFETAELIRARRRNAHTPIIFITAHDRSEREVLRAYRLGAVDFLFKPIIPEVLAAKAAVFVALQRQKAAVRRHAEQVREMERRESLARHAEERRHWEADRLRDENQRKDEFIAVLAHELRNPLASIVAGLALMEQLGIEDAEFDWAVVRMRRQARHLVRLVDDLLDVSRISRGKVTIVPEIIDLRVAVTDALDAHLQAFADGERTIHADLGDAPVLVRGDHVRLVQVFSNILANALEHTKPNGRVHIAVDNDDARAFVTIRDDGDGIEPDQLDRVFGLFEQASPETRGLGIGLAIARQLVELHGGAITAQSDGPGRGATFTVELALQQSVTRDAEEPAAGLRPRLRDYRVTPSPRPQRVAIVEDDDDARDALQMLLEAWGYDVEVATDGQEGVELVVANRPDIVLMDVAMPRMNGYEAAQQIHSELADQTPTLVAMTGFGSEADRKRAHDAGFHVHLLKPVHPDALKAVLQKGTL